MWEDLNHVVAIGNFLFEVFDMSDRPSLSAERHLTN